MSRNTCMVIGATLALAGCNMADKQDAQHDDSSNPYYKKAQQDLDTNPEAAIADYQEALANNPKLLEARYQLGHIYADKMSNPVGAIFYFEEYLRLAPTGAHADDAKALIDKESQAFAASLPNSAAQSADEYAKLQADNATLRKQVEDSTKTILKLQSQIKHHKEGAIAATAPAPAATPSGTTTPTGGPDAPAVAGATPAPAVPPTPSTATDAAAAAVGATNTAAAAPTPPKALPLDAPNPAVTTTGTATAAGAPAADAGPTRTYKIVAGDSLWKIAHKMYPGDTKNGIDKIKDANKDVLIEGKPLKIGQVLVIPQ